MKRIQKMILVILALVVLTACGGGTPAGKDPAAQVVEDFYQAVVSKDTSRIGSLVCKDWEQQANLELDSFQAVKAALNAVVCTVDTTNGSTKTVKCSGSIDVTYNNENQKIDISKRVFTVVQEAGEWRACGYK